MAGDQEVDAVNWGEALDGGASDIRQGLVVGEEVAVEVVAREEVVAQSEVVLFVGEGDGDEVFSGGDKKQADEQDGANEKKALHNNRL